MERSCQILSMNFFRFLKQCLQSALVEEKYTRIIRNASDPGTLLYIRLRGGVGVCLHLVLVLKTPCIVFWPFKTSWFDLSKVFETLDFTFSSFRTPDFTFRPFQDLNTCFPITWDLLVTFFSECAIHIPCVCALLWILSSQYT